MSLTFEQLAKTNLARCLKWHPDGIKSWSASDWATAVAGELGEACSIIKEMNRLRDGLVGNKVGHQDWASLKVALGKELADILIYLDLLAQREDINLGEVVIKKFNEVSIRNGFADFL